MRAVLLIQTSKEVKGTKPFWIQ